MPDLLVRDIDPEVYKRMKATAEAQGKSLAQTVREALTQQFKTSKEDIWAEIDRFRAGIKPIKGSSVDVIRKMRERDVSGR